MQKEIERLKKLRMDGIASSDDKFRLAWEEDRLKQTKEKAKRIREGSNLGARFARRTFETFDKSRDEQAYQKCLDYSEHYSEDERNGLLILGGYGSGKTHLAASIANRLMDNGVPVLFDTLTSHLEKLKAEFNTDGKRTYLEKMKTIDMLVLDDAGKEKVTEWTASVLFDVINYRYEHLLPVVITSNLDSKDLEHYLGSAVYSRLCEMCKGVRTQSGDYRKGH